MWHGLTRRLEGEIVVLEPLGAHHRDALWLAAQHPQIWTWLTPLGDNEQLFDAWFQQGLDAADAGTEGVFATVDSRSGQVIGSTRYLGLRESHRGLEIGWTWLAPSAWRTGSNAEAKLLMLEHAFCQLGCMRVEFKTDSRNEQSRNALAALPAQFEGILRKHMLMPGVGVRDSAYYSVIEEDWPGVRANLKLRVARGRTGGPQSSAGPQVG
jgi:RimJ/RimL family protein N-acetyltransferase